MTRKLLLILLLLVTPAFALSPQLTRQQAEVKAVMTKLKPETPLTKIAAMREKVQAISDITRKKVEMLEGELSQLSLALGEVGVASGKAKAEVEQSSGAHNSELNRKREKKEAEIADCKLVLLSCQQALSRLEEARKTRLARNLGFRGRDIVSVARQVAAETDFTNWRQLLEWPRTAMARAELVRLQPHIFTVLPATMILLLVLLRLWGGLYRVVTAHLQPGNLLFSLNRFLLQRSPLFILLSGLLSAAVLASRFYPAEDFLVLCIFQAALVLYLLLTVPLCARALFFRVVVDRFAGESRFESREKRLFWLLFSLVMALLVLCFSGVARHLLQGQMLELCRFVLLAMATLLLVTTALAVRRRYPQSLLCALFAFVSCAGGLILLVMEGAGWRNLVTWLLQGTGETVVLLGLTIFANDVIELAMSLGEQYGGGLFRRLLPEAEEEELLTIAPGSNSGLVRFACKLLLYLSFFWLLLSIWGGVATEPDSLQSVFTEGVQLGSLLISPARVVVALVMLLLGWSAIRWLKLLLERLWLRKTTISGNSRETVLTLLGYVAFAGLLLLTLEAAGFQLKGLSMVLGAFSVGIGFGLQNVVNNFISGLILMFEQPIKKGNWVKVGGEEGYVKKISIRSTVIQTFDRSDIIMPNSELISTPVTNMMLNDIRGRIKVPIGVAYGTDTALVEKLLLEVAGSHPDVIPPPRRLQPKVYFMEFGDCSLNFILTCYLHDVNKGLSVRSALNFEIDRVFREEGVEIPFPRQEVTLRRD